MFSRYFSKKFGEFDQFLANFSKCVSSLTNKQTNKKRLKTREFEEKKSYRSAFGTKRRGKTVKRLVKLWNLARNE